MAEILVGVMFGYCIEGIFNFACSGSLYGVFDAGDDCFVAVAVVDDCVAFITGDEFFYEGLASSCYGDDWVDVGELCKFDCVCSLDIVRKRSSGGMMTDWTYHGA